MPKSKKLTRPQIIDRFLAHINGVAEYAEKESRWKTPREKIRGAIFSVLAAIDGSAAALPAFNLCPAPHPDDRDYHKERGEDYYPAEREHLNIAGELHSAFCQSEKKE